MSSGPPFWSKIAHMRIKIAEDHADNQRNQHRHQRHNGNVRHPCRAQRNHRKERAITETTEIAPTSRLAAELTLPAQHKVRHSKLLIAAIIATPLRPKIPLRAEKMGAPRPKQSRWRQSNLVSVIVLPCNSASGAAFTLIPYSIHSRKAAISGAAPF